MAGPISRALNLARTIVQTRTATIRTGLQSALKSIRSSSESPATSATDKPIHTEKTSAQLKKFEHFRAGYLNLLRNMADYNSSRGEPPPQASTLIPRASVNSENLLIHSEPLADDLPFESTDVKPSYLLGNNSKLEIPSFLESIKDSESVSQPLQEFNSSSYKASPTLTKEIINKATEMANQKMRKSLGIEGSAAVARR